MSDGRRLRSGVQKGAEIIHLPRGHVFSHVHPNLKEIRTARGVEVWASAPEFKTSVRLFPTFRYSFTSDGERFEVFAVNDPGSWHAAEALFAKHPRARPSRGMVFAVRSLEKAPEVVLGAACIAEMYHNMLPERDVIFKGQFGPDWYERHKKGALKRSCLVRGAKLVCATRFVIAEQARGRHLAQHLAEAIAVAAAKHRWPPAEYLEVVRWMQEDKYQLICAGKKGDFLTASNYNPEPLTRWKHSHDASAKPKTKRAKKVQTIPAFYWRDLKIAAS